MYASSCADLRVTYLELVLHFHMQHEDSLEKLSDMIEHVTLQLNELCNCDITSEYIAEGRLVCNAEEPGEVILQGRIISITGKNSTDLLLALQTWVRDNPMVVVQGVQLKVDPECLVDLHNLGDTECIPHSVGVVGPSVPFPAVGGGIGGLLVIVVLVVIIAVAVFVCVKKKKRTDYSPGEGTEGAK